MDMKSTTYARSPHRVIVEGACERTDCRRAMSALITGALTTFGGRPSERALVVARDHARLGCEAFVASG
jgi:hypothetical protein